MADNIKPEPSKQENNGTASVKASEENSIAKTDLVNTSASIKQENLPENNQGTKTEAKDKTDQDVQSGDKKNTSETTANKNENKQEKVTIGNKKVIVKHEIIKYVNVRIRGKRSRPSKRARKYRMAEAEALSSMAIESISSPDAIACRDDVEYCLTVTNLPNNWSFMDIKNFIDMQCGPVDEIEMIKDDTTSNGGIRLTYQTEDECKQAMMKLSDKEIGGTRLAVSMMVVELSDSEIDIPEPPGEGGGTSKTNTKPWKPDLDLWEIDPKGTYGLKESFLKSLDITPPLDKWVHVSNFRCDKPELRDVLEMAGTVLQCAMFMTANRYANVMYSHPLEAVQAVSMLNGQTFYGQKLKIVMTRCPVNTVLIPKGLAEVGPGLGSYGKPLKSVTKHYRRFLANQTASLNSEAFDIGSNQNGIIEEEKFVVKNVEDLTDADGSTVTADGKADDDRSGSESPEQVIRVKYVAAKRAAKNPKLQLQNQKPPPTPAKIPKQQQGPQNSPRNVGPNMSSFGPQMWNGPGPDPRMRQFGPGPGPRPGWNGPGPMRPMGPRPMGQGLMGPGPMGPGPMGPGPMGPGPMGPGPMGPGLMGPRPMGPGPMGPGPMQGPRPMGPMGGPMHGPMQGAIQGSMQGTIQGPMQGPGPMMGQMQGPMGPTQGPMRPGYPNPNEPVQLQLTNLPPSTTFALLCEKMAACGQVVSIQLTTPGAAVVTFANRMQADVCFQSYNNAYIEGHMIQVKYT